MRGNAVWSALAVTCALLASWTPAPVSAATCASICSTTELWGFGGAPSYSLCQCSGSSGAARSGTDCNCGVCYESGSGHIIGYAKLSTGLCPSGATDCADCDVVSTSSSSSSSDHVTTTPTPSSTNASSSDTPSTSLTPSSTSGGTSNSSAGNSDALTTVTPSPTTTKPSASNVTSSSSSSRATNDTVGATDGTTGTSKNTTSTDSSSSSDSSSKAGLATWQIALIICSCVLVIAVVMVTITSCYCKARNSMKENIQDEQERHEYEQYWQPGDNDAHDQLANSAFGAQLTQGGRSSFTSNHSRPNSAKNVPYSEPTFVPEDRIGMGRPSMRQSLGSSSDLPAVFQPFPQRDRPSHEVGSRKNIAIEL